MNYSGYVRLTIKILSVEDCKMKLKVKIPMGDCKMWDVCLVAAPNLGHHISITSILSWEHDQHFPPDTKSRQLQLLLNRVNDWIFGMKRKTENHSGQETNINRQGLGLWSWATTGPVIRDILYQKSSSIWTLCI